LRKAIFAVPFRNSAAEPGSNPLSRSGKAGNLRTLDGAKGMIALVWRYEVREEARAAFEATYAPTGAWAQLFARGEGYRGTELFRAEDGSYLTLDIWRSHADFEAFLDAHRADYEALDRSTESWTAAEHRIGEFEVMG
jgi:heme-degrading monooxygenase HmoA